MEIDAEGNYRGKMEKTNVVVSAFGTNLKYIENQMRKGTELPIKKRTSSARDLRATIAQGVNETDSNGDVPSPKTNIPQNGNGVNALDVENSAAKAQQAETEEEARLRTLYESEPTGKYAGTTREDKTLLQTDVLLSAFADENGIVPVRLTVKEYKDKDNSLYALITLEKIETEVSGRGESLSTTPTPYPVS